MDDLNDMEFTALEFRDFLNKLGITCAEFDELFGLFPGTAERCLVSGFTAERELLQYSAHHQSGSH